MKKIGLIGGIGPESSIEYYRLIIKRYQEKLNTKNYPDLVINSINMTEMLNYVFNNQLDKLVPFLVERIKIFETLGLDYVAIASNTPHLVFDRLVENVNIPLISIVKETCMEISNKKLHKAGLFGTKSTMTSGFYKNVAASYGIEVIIPDAEGQDYIHEKYMSEMIFNRIVPETKLQLIKIANKLIEKESIEGIILGGTELPLILKPSDFPGIVVFDTTVIHVESIVNKMIEN